jgi:hypothetical protein
MVEHVVVPEAKDTVAASPELGAAAIIRCLLERMLTAIELARRRRRDIRAFARNGFAYPTSPSLSAPPGGEVRDETRRGG